LLLAWLVLFYFNVWGYFLRLQLGVVLFALFVLAFWALFSVGGGGYVFNRGAIDAGVFFLQYIICDLFAGMEI
ncbi:hypothetical protein, partial [Marinovum sp. 1_MG-2023]|uniref:hypothetical protein n=1 Tax=Marinovum sp. 1_MG-2023 TaxID=3062633 RepID=UPI0026E31AFC